MDNTQAAINMMDKLHERGIRMSIDDFGTGYSSLSYLKQFKVYKRVERFVLEHTGEFRRMKNTVLLDGVLCDGWGGACDRSCFFFWREAWLKRVDPHG